MNIALLLILPAAVVAAVGVGLHMRWLRRRATHRRIFNDLLLPSLSDERFAPRDAALLPAPVSRYFAHCVPTDRPIARTVDLDLVGETRAHPTSDWVRFEARHRICPGRGFLWQARLEGLGPLIAEGAEFLSDGHPGVDYCLGGWLPLVGGRGEEYRVAAAERLVAESFWLPSSLLPGRGVRWEALGEHRATAVHAVNTGNVAVSATIDDDGALVELSMVRLRRSSDGQSYTTPFAFCFQDEARFDGYVVPRRVQAIWDYGTDTQFEFMRFELEDARFY